MTEKPRPSPQPKISPPRIPDEEDDDDRVERKEKMRPDRIMPPIDIPPDDDSD
jgi:hypothetical protein